MKNILISLVSDQTVPNILAIHHFKPDELLFLSTDEMERKEKVDAIINTLSRLDLNAKDKSTKVIVCEDSILDCHKKLEGWIEGKEDFEFIVNLTGGTKIMSISAYEFFKDYSSKMIYIPIPKNEFIIPFPKKSPGKPVKLQLRLNVTQYLTAYGLNIINEGRLKVYEEEALGRNKLSQHIVANYESVKNLLIWLSGSLRSHRNHRQFHFKGTYSVPTDQERDLLTRLSFSYERDLASKILTKSEIRYLTGGWLEEFTFNAIHELLGQGVDDVTIGLAMQNPSGRDNEFDVMFTKENELYFIECKSLDQQEDRETDVLYKIGALQKEFGLRVKSFLVTTSPFVMRDGQLNEATRARAEQFKTEIISPNDVINLKGILTEKLNIKG